MTSNSGVKKLQRLVVIYRIVQLFLLALLIFMAVNFQAQFRAKGMPQVFTNSIIISIVIQMLALYPLNRFARGEAENELASTAPGLSEEQMKALRQKRLYGDFLKFAVFIFFLTFSLRAPSSLFIQSTILFSFILTSITYFQCHNFAIKRLLAGK